MLTQNYEPIVVVTHDKIVLFDGLRVHAVTPYTGKRYSIVYFTHNCFRRADEAILQCLHRPPTEAVLINLRDMLCPPRGYDQKFKTQTIAECLFGVSTRPHSESWAAQKSISNLQDDALQAILSFVLTIGSAWGIAAVNRRCSSMIFRSGSWAGTVVDSTNILPAGIRAQNLWKAWGSAKYVVTGQWALTHVSLRLARKHWVWLWKLSADSSPYFKIPGGMLLVGNQPSRRFSCEFLLDKIPNGRLAVGLSNSSDPTEIARAIRGELEGGIRAVLAYIGKGNGFRYNAKQLGGGAPQKNGFESEVHVEFSQDRTRPEGDLTRMELRLNSVLVSYCEAGIDIEGTIYPIALFKHRPRGALRPCFS